MFFMHPSHRFIFLDSQIKPDKPTCRIGHKDTALIENPEQDVNRLISFLDNFDREIEKKREEIFSQYDGKIYTSNPELWDL